MGFKAGSPDAREDEVDCVVCREVLLAVGNGIYSHKGKHGKAEDRKHRVQARFVHGRPGVVVQGLLGFGRAGADGPG